MKKVFFAIAMLAAGIFSANAEVSFSLGDAQTVNKGEEVEILIAATSTPDTIDAYDITLEIDGALDYATMLNEDDDEVLAVTSKRSSINIQYNLWTNQTTLRVLGYPGTTSAPFTGTKTILSVKISTENTPGGTYNVTLSNAKVTKRSVNAETNKVTKTTLTVEGSFSTSITVISPTYYLAGDAAIMPVGTAGMPTSLEIDENGLTFTNIDHLLIGTYNYNVTVGNAADATVYATGEPLVIESNGMYTIVYTFDEAAKTITAVATRVADATSLGELDAVSAEKLLIDGNVIIRRNGVDYTVTGQKL